QVNSTSLWHMAALLVVQESTSSTRVVFLFTWTYNIRLPYSHTSAIAIDNQCQVDSLCPLLHDDIIIPVENQSATSM
ncbi:hypothetical protein BDF22DRAFT_700949, partial [Syncephalis plumigaleata]